MPQARLRPRTRSHCKANRRRWMKAIRIIPRKFTAVFSNRVRTRRHCFSQPISRSMVLRARIGFRIEVDGAGVAILAGLGWNHRPKLQVEQVLINPVSPIAPIAGQSDRPRDRPAICVEHPSSRRLQSASPPRRRIREPGRHSRPRAADGLAHRTAGGSRIIGFHCGMAVGNTVSVRPSPSRARPEGLGNTPGPVGRRVPVFC